MPTPTLSSAVGTGEAAKFEFGGVVALSAGHAVHDTYSAFLAPLLPAFIENLALSTTQAGVLSMLIQLPSLAQPFIGHLADRYNLRILVPLGLLGTAVAMSLLGIAPGYWAMALCLTVAGLASACLHAVGPVMAGNLSGRRLGQGMGFWMVGGELGRTLGPIIVVSTVGWLSLRGTPLLMLAGMPVAALLAVRLRNTPVGAPGGPAHLPWRQTLAGIGSALAPLAGIVFTRSFAIAALSTFLPTLLRQQGASFWLAGASLSLFEAAGTVGALLGGSLSDRLGRRRVLLASMLATPLLMFVFLWVDGWLRLPLLLLLGLVGLSITPVIMAVAQESVPGNRALANGVYMAANFAATSLALLAIGVMGDLFGLPTAFAVSAALLLAGLPLLRFLPQPAAARRA
ncbi:MAG TPA: MFS transporter [Anaerolineae bacterium]|nr:MFS transporter [Anaerolineae bacterium]